MTSRMHSTLAAMIVAGAMAAITASGAAAGGKPSSVIRYSEPGSTGYVATGVTIPPRLANFREPGSVGWVPASTKVTIPAWLVNFREPGSVGWVPAAGATATVTSAGGLDWASALIGGGVVLGTTLVCAGALVVVRRHRSFAHA